MREKVKMIRVTCDGCGSVAYVADRSDDDRQGYHGTVRHIHERGGSARVDWFACSDACINPAVLEAIRVDGQP